MKKIDQKKIGLYQKFHVTRKDGRHKEGEKHHNCKYFVLDLTHDPYVWAALECYAIEVAVEDNHAPNPRLSKQLFGLLTEHFGSGSRDLKETAEDKKFDGLDDRYSVARVDGRSAEGEKHHGCKYFVIDMTHDYCALSAIEQYGLACKSEYPKLAKDLFDRMERCCPSFLLPGFKPPFKK
jgi:hypothetical protein